MIVLILLIIIVSHVCQLSFASLLSLCTGCGAIFKDGAAMDFGKNNSTTAKLNNENNASCLF